MQATPPAPAPRDPYAALRLPDFRRLTVGRMLTTLSTQMISVAIGWELYEKTGSALMLGAIGLVQVLPIMLLTLPAGHLADQRDRRQIVVTAQIALAFSSLGLALLSALQGPIVLIYGCLLLIGVARAFNDPAGAALLPMTVPPEHFTNAATWGSSTRQFAAVLGPALGGLIIALAQSATPVYALNVGICLITALLIARIRGRPATLSRERPTLTSLLAGVTFLWRSPLLLGAITLDLFAVLFGGATALLPIYAKDILQVGPDGLGWLRAAPSIGAVLMALLIAYLPPFRRAGLTLLMAVAGFGVATIVFGLSHSFILSLAMLFVLGALDNISVVIRSSLLLLRTPDEMRGRVSAVNSVFIGASNELGGFESGVAAALLGPVGAVVLGGIATIVVVLLVALFSPELRRLGALHKA
jgi:MFS family permease